MERKNIVLITGGNGNIAQAVIKKYLENNCFVIGADLQKEVMNKELEKNQNFSYYKCDVTKVKDIEELKEKFEEVIKKVIKKAQELKIWDNFSEDTELTYQTLKEIFDMKMIYLQNLNIQCKYENKELYIEYYDDTIIESSIKIKADTVKIKKKIKLFI